MQTLIDIFPRSGAGGASFFPRVSPRGLTGKPCPLPAGSVLVWMAAETHQHQQSTGSGLVWPQLPTKLFVGRICWLHKEQPQASKQGWQSLEPALPGIPNTSGMGTCSVGVGLGGWALCFKWQGQKGMTGSKIPSDPISC